MGATYKRAVQVITILVLVAVTAFGAGCFSGSTGYGYLRGTTIDAFTGEPLAVKATVYVGSRYTLVTYDGTFATGRLSPGTYSLTVSASGYAERTIPVVIAASKTTHVDVKVAEKPSAGHATIVGHATLVNDPHTYPQPGAVSRTMLQQRPFSLVSDPTATAVTDTPQSLQVRKAPTVSDEEFRAALEAQGYVIEDYLPLTQVYVVRPSDTQARTLSATPESLSIDLSVLPAVDWAYPDYLAHATTMAVEPNDPLYHTYQWHYRAISLPRAWSVQQGFTRPVTVAVVDTGIRPEHPDLAASIVDGRDFVDGDNDPTDWPFMNNRMNGASHGTHVAGTIAALTNNARGVAGVNWFARIMPIRALDGNGNGPFSRIAEAIMWAVDNGADIINLSLSGAVEPGPALRESVQYAVSQGVILVAAAGNSSSSIPEYPASLPGVISVAATGIANNLAGYSNYGPSVTLAAPGGSERDSGVYSTGYSAKDPRLEDYFHMKGTSMATPHVSGVISLILAEHGWMSPEEVAELLCDTAQDLGDDGRDDIYGAGLVNAYAAVTRSTMDRARFWVSGYDGNPVSSGYYGRRDRSFYVEDAQPGDHLLVGWLDVDGDGSIDTGDFYGSALVKLSADKVLYMQERLELHPYDSSRTASAASLEPWMLNVPATWIRN